MNEVQERDQKLLNASEDLKRIIQEVVVRRELAVFERNRLEVVIRGMGEGVIVVNQEKEIELINNRAKEMLGYPADEDLPEEYRRSFVAQLWDESEYKLTRISLWGRCFPVLKLSNFITKNNQRK